MFEITNKKRVCSRLSFSNAKYFIMQLGTLCETILEQSVLWNLKINQYFSVEDKFNGSTTITICPLQLNDSSGIVTKSLATEIIVSRD